MLVLGICRYQLFPSEGAIRVTKGDPHKVDARPYESPAYDSSSSCLVVGTKSEKEQNNIIC